MRNPVAPAAAKDSNPIIDSINDVFKSHFQFGPANMRAIPHSLGFACKFLCDCLT